MHQQVKGRLDATLHNWHQSLQFRYGDPRVYEMQQEAMRRQEMAALYETARLQSKPDIYQANVEKNRKAHAERLESIRRRSRPESGTPPQSLEGADLPRKRGRPRKHPVAQR